MEYFEESLQVKVKAAYDVIVVGGGVAGVSAAIAASRSGCSTLIIEKGIYFGGLATLGLIAYYEPICDGRGRKIIGGIAEELLHLSVKYGFNTIPEEWKHRQDTVDTNKRYDTRFSPTSFVLALDEIIMKEKVDILFDTVFCSTVMEDGICKGVIVENKEGRLGYKGKVIIDTTGDLDVMAGAGAKFVEADNWLSFVSYFTSMEDMKKAVESGEVHRGVRSRMLGFDRLGKGSRKDTRKYKASDASEITEFILEGRRLLLADYLESCSREDRYMLMIPAMAQFRTTRRLCGCYELTEKDEYVHFEDSIGCICDFSKAGPVYEVPYRTLISDDIKNIITAGRTIASSGHAWEITRVIPPASLTGQAAGTTAAISVKLGCSLTEVPVEKLQCALGDAGVMIHF